MSGQNKYTRLLSNTVLFAISTFSSKVLSFVLTRLYTSVLSEASLGIADLVVISTNLLIPLVSLGISNAVIRFGLEKGVPKKGVFTGGLIAIAMGFVVLLAFTPLLGKVSLLQGLLPYMLVFVLTSCLRTLCCQFVRAKQYTRLYAVDGILCTLSTVGFNLLFLVGLRMGSTGYLLSIICADGLSVLFLTFVARLWQYIDFKRYDFGLLGRMLKYSLPLVPALMFWWVTNASDRYFIAYMCGLDANGLYTVAYRIPSLMAVVSTIFTEAWQLSAFTDGTKPGRERFFSQVYGGVMGVGFAAGAGLILLCRPIMHLLVDAQAHPEYFAAWAYVPLLVVASVFSTLVSFMNSIYMLEKKPTRALVTMMVGALLNLPLNWLLIGRFGPNGAAMATFISYFVVFLLRIVDTRRLLRFRFLPLRLACNTVLLVGEAGLMMAQVKYWPLWCGLIVAVLVVVNLRGLVRAAHQLLSRRRGGQAGAG